MDRVIDIKSFIKLFDIPNTKFYSFNLHFSASFQTQLIVSQALLRIRGNRDILTSKENTHGREQIVLSIQLLL